MGKDYLYKILINYFYRCSLDTTIFSHPKYDLEDVAKIYWNAYDKYYKDADTDWHFLTFSFKFPDQQKISISCKIRTCIQISDDEGLTNCELIPKVLIFTLCKIFHFS